MAKYLHLFGQLFRRYPFVTNSAVYGGLYVGAEFSQQFLSKKILVKHSTTMRYTSSSYVLFVKCENVIVCVCVSSLYTVPFLLTNTYDISYMCVLECVLLYKCLPPNHHIVRVQNIAVNGVVCCSNVVAMSRRT